MAETAGPSESPDQSTRDDVLNGLGFDAVARQERPSIAEDFVFDPADYASARQLRVVHEEVTLEETPLAVVRQVHLEDTERPQTSLRLSLTLCWNGFGDAMTLLARYPRRFQRAILPAAIVNAAERYGTGDFGLAWSWSGEGDPDCIAYVSNNVVVTVEGRGANDSVLPLARELSDALGELRTVDGYEASATGVLEDARRRAGDVARLRPGESLDLGNLGDGESRFFFLTTSGAVNRSADREGSWYYRAGADEGRHDVRLFRVGRGILATMERLVVEII